MVAEMQDNPQPVESGRSTPRDADPASKMPRTRTGIFIGLGLGLLSDIGVWNDLGDRARTALLGYSHCFACRPREIDFKPQEQGPAFDMCYSGSCRIPT